MKDNRGITITISQIVMLLISVMVIVEPLSFTTVPQSSFVIQRRVEFVDVPVNNQSMIITNISSSEAVEINNSSNYYQALTSSWNVSAGDVLQFNARDGNGNFAAFNHVISQEDIENEGFMRRFMRNISFEPDIWIYPAEFNVTLHRGDTAEENITIGNNGTALLEFKIRDRIGLPPTTSTVSSPETMFKRANGSPSGIKNENESEICPEGVNKTSEANPFDFSDIHFIYDVEGPSGDFQCLGVEFNGTHFFITGGNSGNQPNKVYIFDRDGNYVRSFNQTTDTYWGWRDLAWDGTYLYGSEDNYVDQFYPNGTYVGRFPGPGISPCRALAYDPATDHFWTADGDSPIYEFDRNGTVIHEYSNDFPIYGMAWDDVSPDGPWLWIFAQKGYPAAATIYQFDPINGKYTGVSFKGWYNASQYGVAGGLCFTTEWDKNYSILVGLTQNFPDCIVGYEISLIDAKWLTEYPTEGNVLPGNHMNISVTFNASHIADGEYNATIIIESNDPDEGTMLIPVNMTVIPPEHDIAVKNIKVSDAVEVNTTVIVNGTVCNLGLNDETNIVVDFIVDGIIEDNTNIPMLERACCADVAFLWNTPDREGKHNISIYARPVNETIVYNNMMTKNISVITVADIRVEPRSYEFTIERGEVKCKNLTIGNSGSGVLIFNITAQSRAAPPAHMNTHLTTEKEISYKNAQIIVKQKFKKPSVENVRKRVGVNEKECARIDIQNLPRIVKTGEPVLPVKHMRILLPYGKDVQSIEVKGEKHDLVGTYYVEPGEPPVPIGIPLEEPPKVFPKKSIYSSTKPYPGLYEASVQSLRGYKILVLNLYPVQYIPKLGKISYYTSMEVVINMKSGENRLYRGLKKDKERVIHVVDNPEIADTYPLTNFTPTYDHVIITNSTFASAFQRLADWKTRKGVKSHVVTVEYINSTFAGRDLQEKIRNYIIYAYMNEGIEYVLLGGDGDGANVGGESGDAVIPHRGFYDFVLAFPRPAEDYDIPADIYYAALDGTWNDDNDEKWGEPGEDDLYAEVFVGRAAVDSLEEVSNFINKTIAYESISADDPYLKEAWMLGEDLHWTVWGGDYKDEIRKGSCSKYCTVGFPKKYNVSTLYDRDYPGYNWPKSVLINIMNENTPLIFNHIGHATVDHVMKMRNRDVDTLTNKKYFFAYSQGCYAGSFDNRDESGTYLRYDCIAEHFTASPHGAFAFIGNSRYGWGSPMDTDGPSQHYDRQFYDALFNESIGNLGNALQDSKEDNIWQINGSAMRWCYYEINLFGDPETSLIPTGVSWLFFSPDNGTVNSGNYTNVSVCVNTTRLDKDIYTASIIVESNDPDENLVLIPVNLMVLTPPHIISFSPADLNLTQYVGSSYSFTVVTDQVMTSNIWYVTPECPNMTGNGTPSLTITWNHTGIYNVTYIGSNENGSVSITWNVSVIGVGGVATAVRPKVISVSKTGKLGNITVNLTVFVVSTEEFNDTFSVSLTTEGIPPEYRADLSWFNWTHKEVSLPARGETEIPLHAEIPEGEKGVKAFKVFVESEKCPATKSFDTGIFVIE